MRCFVCFLKEYRCGIARVAVLLISVVMCLSACSPPSGVTNDFSYADNSFSASVEGTFTRLSSDGYSGSEGLVGTPLTGVPQAVAATVTVGEPTPDGRSVSVTFSEPAALAGVTVTGMWGGTESGTAVTVTYPEGVALPLSPDAASAFAPLLRFGTALLPTGDIMAVSPYLTGDPQGGIDSGARRTVTRREAGVDREVQFTFADKAEPLLPRRVTVKTPAEQIELSVGAVAP